jgi:hypothetical protein
MTNNTAFIVKVESIEKIEGADKIVKVSFSLNGIVLGQVVSGLNDFNVGDLAVYFDANMALEDEFISSIDKLSPGYATEEFKGIKTYLAKGNRIRCIKLRNTISSGLLIPIWKFFQFTDLRGKDPLWQEGFSFTELNGFKVCHKWLPPASNKTPVLKEHKSQKKRVSRVIPEQFHFYVDTQQLLRNLQDISPDDVGSISRKIHGSSFIVSKSLVLRKLSFIDKIAKVFNVKIQDKKYDYLYASRSVIKNDAERTGFYKVDIWTHLGKKYFEGKLHDGETVYGEVVGYLPDTQTMIQKDYDYGNKPGSYSIAVYRITMTSPDGAVISLDWNAMKERCRELNVPMVQEFYYGKLKDMYPSFDGVLNHWANPSWTEEQIQVWRNKFVEKLKEDFLERDALDNLSKKVPDEGIVLRIEGLGIRVYKLKSAKFVMHESAAREAEVVDIEDQESI